MPINAPLTIENFEFEKLRAKTPESKKSGVFTCLVIPFKFDEGDPIIKINGKFRNM